MSTPLEQTLAEAIAASPLNPVSDPLVEVVAIIDEELLT